MLVAVTNCGVTTDGRNGILLVLEETGCKCGIDDLQIIIITYSTSVLTY